VPEPSPPRLSLTSRRRVGVAMAERARSGRRLTPAVPGRRGEDKDDAHLLPWPLSSSSLARHRLSLFPQLHPNAAVVGPP
jgi:hypothetical protein